MIPGMNPLAGMNPMGGGGDDKKEPEEEDPELIEQRRIEEEKRKEKHRRAEIEREKMRQGIRDKYGLEKKEDPFAEMLAAEAARGIPQQKEETMIPANMSEGLDKMKNLTGDLGAKAGEMKEKCTIM